MNKLGFYTKNFGAPGVIAAIESLKPPVLLTELDDKSILRKIRNELSPDTFVIGRLFFPHSLQGPALDHPDPVKVGIELAEHILAHDFNFATQRGQNGRLFVDAWMSLNESIPGPASAVFKEHPDLIARRSATYDTLQVAFLERLRAEGLEAIAFNFAAGNWITGEDYLEYFPKTLDAYTYLGFHEYGWPHMNPDEPGTKSGCGFYRDIMARIRQDYGDQHRVIMTEAGLARMYMHSKVHPQDDRPEKDADVGWLYGWDSVSEESYKRSLRWYNQSLVENDYVIGACLFQVGPGGKWVTFRHTGEDNQGQTLTLMDELHAMALEPKPEPVETPTPSEPPTVPELSLEETLRAIGEPLVIPLNPKAMLYKVARQNSLGERLTGEFEATYQDQCYVAQIYEKGLVYAPVGQWDQAQFIRTPRTRDVAPAPDMAWTHHITGFLGNRWQYWEGHLKDKIPGLTWEIFAKEVLKHNPGLEADGFVFRAHKSYVMPQVEGEVPAHAEQPAVVSAAAQPHPPATTAAPSPDFVQVVDAQFQLKAQPMRFVGVNIRGLVHYGHDLDYFRHAPIEHRRQQLHAANTMNARLVRVFLAHRDATPEQIEARLREVVELIKQHFPNIYLLPSLTNLYEDVPFYVRGDEKFYEVQSSDGKRMLNKAFFAGGYKENYLPLVEHIVKAFRNEPHIFAWEIGNELKAEREPKVFVDFNKAVAEAIKGWDSNHMVTTGMVSTRHAWMGDKPDLRRDLYRSCHINFITVHAYNGNEHPPEIEDDSDLAREFEKPFIIEEAGFDRNIYPNRPEKTRTDMANWFRKGASCYMPWGFVATDHDNNDGDINVGMTGPLHPDYPLLFELHKQCGHLLLKSGISEDVSPAIANIDFHRQRGLPPAMPWPLLADGFDFPVGKPDGLGYYVAADLVNQAYYAERQAWHTGEDWNRKLGPGDTPDVDLGDPVYATAHGRVVTSQRFPTWGNIVLIEHCLPSGQTVWSQYAHLQQRLVRKGDILRRGDRIGRIGKGGDDHLPAHLHFEIRLKRLPASKWGYQKPEDREQVLLAYAHPSNFINSYRPK
ncbi:MAG: peptidoglycan DD-metalloendopeptidase family protein [Anaerolineales bacterium]|nr:MAG: peptidoglycan DD-metalloendopeptidase family protein [Anaerolineales bacterium]